MLDQETKRKIDNARDILVGKVPDPKSQVEQITIALIYKFMDDMDKESEEWGGKATFFTGEYEKYAWSRIFDPRLGGFDLINTYSEAIIKMNHNPNIPQLFRDIFKNAYLPYRDPETLKSFLKEINEFHYDHSERLGDAFEYLLSVLGSQGEAGQFRTPRHIIDFIVSVVDPKKNDTIADPACGTAGFLISSYKHILKHNTSADSPLERGGSAEQKRGVSGDKLTPDERKRLLNNFVGYDISPDMVRLSLVNMYLHEFPDPKIHEYDTLTSEERWNETYDVILANPPFMTPKGGIRPHKRFSVQAKRSEVLFVDYIAEHLNPNGRAGVIVPEGIVFQSANAYKNLRKMLVEDYLWAVVSLPAGVFQPYSGVKTSILLMDKMLAKKTDKILFVKIENDGFDLGAQRRPIDKNDLPQALDFIKSYHQAVMNNTEVENTDYAHAVEKSKIAESGDWNLSGERYKDNKSIQNHNWEMVKLGEVAEIIAGQSPEGKYYNSKGKGTPFYQGKTEFRNIFLGKPCKWTTQVTKEAIPNDILISVRAPVGPVNICPEKICIGRGLAAIRASDKLNYKYLFYLLRSKENDIKGDGGLVFDNISRMQIEDIKIPLPPLSIQQEIVTEIDSYQKIIDGARQVVDNYKPTIKIDPDWEIVELKSLVNIKTGKLNANQAVENGKYLFFTCSKEVFRIDNFAFDCEALLLSGNNAVGVFDVKYYKGKFNAYQRTYVITINQQYVNNLKYTFLRYQLENHLELLKNKSIGSNTRYLTIGMIECLPIATPHLSIQQEIVSLIEEEQEIVNANKKLIAIFEQKIKAKISEVWGDSKK